MALVKHGLGEILSEQDDIVKSAGITKRDLEEIEQEGRDADDA